MELDPRSKVALMGSGETAPSMVKVHRTLIESMADEPRPVLIDTTYGFQENADELTAKAQAYFKESLGLDLAVASLRRAVDAGPLERGRFRDALQRGNYLFAGPGSPSYALGNLRAVDAGGVLRAQLARPVIIAFASAAAVTVGRFAIPVYEIYKVGQDPVWLEGLDLLSALGISAAVVPHWDNHEGATHDTSCCYIGARRLGVLEAQLPPEAVVIGIDEHTCVVFGADGTYEVLGRGGWTIRQAGEERYVPSGTKGLIADVIHGAHALVADAPRVGVLDGSPEEGARARFERSLAARDVAGALQVIAEEVEAGRVETALALLVRCADAASEGLVPREEVIAPFVELALSLRADARSARNYRAADVIRDALGAEGVVIEDGAEGSSWRLEER